MNKITIDRIIVKLRLEVCPIHGKSAKFFAKNGVIVISEYCCSDFYQHLTMVTQDEIDKLTDRF
jgi:hypothetical protein